MKGIRVFHILKHTNTKTKVLEVVYAKRTTDVIDIFSKYVGFICTKNSLRDKVGGTLFRNKTINAANEISVALKGKCGDKPKYEIAIVLRKDREEFPNRKKQKPPKEHIKKFD